MSIPSSTKFKANNLNYSSEDLINIFDTYSTIQPTPSVTTKFKAGGYDLGQIFVSIPLGSGSTPDTGFKTNISGTKYDLAKVFQATGSTAAIPFDTNASYSYIYDYSNYKYYLTITSDGTFQYTADIAGNIDLIIVGGGGGGAGTNGVANTAGGGGGGGGAIDVYGTMTNDTSTGFAKNTAYTITIGSGGTGGGTSGSAGSTSKFTLTSTLTDLVTSTGGSGGVRSFGQSGEAAQGGSYISVLYLTDAYTTLSGAGGNGGETTVAANYTGTNGYSSRLSVNYYGGGTGTYYTSIANTFLIYNLMLFSGGGGGATDGASSNGFASWSGNGLIEFGGGLYGYATNTTQPISSSTVFYSENNNPPTSANFPTLTSAINGYAPGAGGGGVGYQLNSSSVTSGGNGANGVVKTYFSYIPPSLTISPSGYFSITGNAKYYLMNDGTDNYIIINCYSGLSTITFYGSTTCNVIAVGGGGGGAGGSGTTSPLTSGAGGGGGGAATYSDTFISGTYNITVGAGGSGGGGASNGSAGGTTSVVSGATTLISCTGGGGGVYSSSQAATGGTAGSATSSLTYIAGGSGGAGGQGSENGSDPSPLTSANQASYGITSDLVSTTLPDNTRMFLAGGGAGGACNYEGVPPYNYYGGSAGHGYGGWVGASFIGNNGLNEYGDVNGQNAVCYGAGGGGGSSNGTTSGGNGAPGIVLFYFQISP